MFSEQFSTQQVICNKTVSCCPTLNGGVIHKPNHVSCYYLEWNISHGLGQVIRLQTVPVVQVFPQENSQLQRNWGPQKHKKFRRNPTAASHPSVVQFEHQYQYQYQVVRYRVHVFVLVKEFQYHSSVTTLCQHNVHLRNDGSPGAQVRTNSHWLSVSSARSYRWVWSAA